MNCVSYDICMYHFCFCLCFFPWGIPPLQNVAGACSVTTDLIMRVNNVRTTTTTKTTSPTVLLSLLVGVDCLKSCCRNASDIKQQQQQHLEENRKSQGTHTCSCRYYREDGGAIHRRSNCPSVVRHAARSTHTSRSVDWQGEPPTAYMPGSSAVVGGPIRRNKRRSLLFHSYCCIADY